MHVAGSIYIFLLVFIDFVILENFEIPLAPYNVKLMCRQGRRFTKVAQSPNQCPSSSTSCGFFEFSSQDHNNGSPQTGVYDCVDGGILTEDSGEEEHRDDRMRPPPFAEMCGAIPKCTTVSVDQLNPAFIKYIVQEYDIKLEGLESMKIRFCCALFHSTLQKMVTTPDYQYPQNTGPPIHCQGRTCGAGAVGCLLHSEHDENDYEEYDDRKMKKRQKRLSLNDYVEDDDYVNAVELSFDDLDVELITREPETVTEEKNGAEKVEVEAETKTTTAKPTLPSLKLPMTLDDLTTSTSTTTTTPSPPVFYTPAASVPTTSHPKVIKKLPDDNDDEGTRPPYRKNTIFFAKHDVSQESPGEFDEEDLMQSTHCVYRHLNNEFYRYCLLVHQSRDGDRCYHHQGHTICCCFVAPDGETCDPTEMDLIIPPPKSLPPRVIITVAPSTTTTTTSSTTTTTTEVPITTSTITTTPTSMVEVAKPTYPSLPPQIYRPRPIDQIKRRKQMRKKCRVTYVRTKSGSRTRPVLVCDAASPNQYSTYLYILSIVVVPFFCSILSPFAFALF